MLVALSLASAGCEGEAPATANSEPEAPPSAATAHVPQSAETSPGQSSRAAGIDGRWLVSSSNGDFTVELIAAEQGLRGYVRGPNCPPMPIKIGVLSDDAFLFETTGGGAGWLWSGQLSAEGLQGQRENVQTGAVESFTARRLE